MMAVLVLICLGITVQALKLCEDRPDHKITTNCTMTTPKLIGCSINNYTIYNMTGDIVEEGDLTAWAGGIYSFNFSLGKGEYLIQLCDGGVREVVAESEVDEEMGSLSVTILILFITIGVFALPKIVKRFSENEILNVTLKGLCIVFGLLLLSLDIGMIVTMADEADLGVSQELFRYLWIVNWAAYIAMVLVILGFGWRVLQLWRERKRKKGYGEL